MLRRRPTETGSGKAPEREALRARAEPPVAFLLAVLASLTLLGCATATPKGRSVLAGNAAQNVLILPLNVTAAMSPELDGLAAPVWAELEAYLRIGNRRLRTAPFQDARRLWLRSIQQARENAKGAKVGFDEAARLLVFEFAKHADFDTLVIPSLFVREAAISGTSAEWDGVARELQFVGGDRATEDDDGEKEMTFVGNAPAASLHAVVLDASGEKLQDGVGGLELLVRVVDRKLLGPGEIVDLAFAPYEGPFGDRERVREGIMRALEPFFPPPLDSELR